MRSRVGSTGGASAPQRWVSGTSLGMSQCWAVMWAIDGPDSAEPIAGQARAVGSWTSALLWRHWGRD